MRTDLERCYRNKSKKSRIRTAEKNFRMKVEENDLTAAKTHLSDVMSLYDKATKSGIIHHNRSSRKKSQLTLLYQRASGK